MKNDLDMKVFGSRLKKARLEKGMTQKELSDLTGISTVMISSYERSDAETGKNPSLNNVYSLASVLGMSIDWLCGMVDERTEVLSSDDLTTMSFLITFINMLSNIRDSELSKLTKSMNSSFDGITIQIYKPIMGSKKKHNLYHFVKDYLEVLPVLRNAGLPEEIQETIVMKIVNDYKDYSLKELLSDGFMIGR